MIDEACQNFYCRDNVSLVIVDLAKHYQDNGNNSTDEPVVTSNDLKKVHSQLSVPNFPPFMGFAEGSTIPPVGYPMVLPMQ